jgi:hypothetical protein
MRTLEMTITPDMAATWLETSEGNRRIRQDHVNTLADHIRHGRWRLTHDPIAFDHNGKLVDGQHRLWAIVLAGKAVRAMVSYYERGQYDQSVADAINGGRPWRPADRLPDPPRLVAVYTALLRVSLPGAGAPALHRLYAMRERFRPIGLRLIGAYDHHIRMFSTSGYRAAAIMAVEAGDATEEYAFSLYKSMGSIRIYDLPRVAQSLHGQRVARGKAKLIDPQVEDYVKGRFLFAEANRDKITRITDGFRKGVIAQAKEMVLKAIQEYELLH